MMKDNQKDNRNQHAGNLSKEKTNVGFEKKNSIPNEIQKKQQTPNEEVPNIGDHEKENVNKDFDKKGPAIKPNDAARDNVTPKIKKEDDVDRDIKNIGLDSIEEELPEEQESK
jgi:hypothetical protein